jgi:hypothetical protein
MSIWNFNRRNWKHEISLEAHLEKNTSIKIELKHAVRMWIWIKWHIVQTGELSQQTFGSHEIPEISWMPGSALSPGGSRWPVSSEAWVEPRSVCMISSVDKTALRQDFLRVLQLHLISIIPSMWYVCNILVCHRRYIISSNWRLRSIKHFFVGMSLFSLLQKLGVH